MKKFRKCRPLLPEIKEDCKLSMTGHWKCADSTGGPTVFDIYNSPILYILYYTILYYIEIYYTKIIVNDKMS